MKNYIQLQEGIPPSLSVGLMTMSIFVSAEFIAILTGYAVLGGYLGVRPAFGKKKQIPAKRNGRDL